MTAPLDTAVRSVVWGRSRGRVRAVWRITVPLLSGLLTFVASVLAVEAAGAPMGTVLVVAWMATALVVLVVVRATARHLDQRPFAKYGFRISREWWVDLIGGIVLGSLTIAMTFLVSYRFGWLILPEGGLMVGSVSPVWLSAFLIGFIAVAFWEELVFRGVFVMNGIEGLTERGHSRVTAALFALIGSSVVFALVNVPGAVSEGHSAWFTALWTLSAGLLWGVAYLLTGELALPIGLHLGFNYVSSNVFGINGVAELEGVPTVFVVESTTTGLTAPMSGIPIIVSNVVGIVLVICWCYWRGRSLTLALDSLQTRTDSRPAL